MVTLYGLYDRIAGKFISTFTEANDNTAKRNFKTVRTDPQTIIGRFPEDFELWKLAIIDEHEGITEIKKEYIEGGAIVNE